MSTSCVRGGRNPSLVLPRARDWFGTTSSQTPRSMERRQKSLHRLLATALGLGAKPEVGFEGSGLAGIVTN